MNVRNAKKDDIPFIVNAIIEIEKTPDSNTFNNLFGCDTETTRRYLTQFLNDDENLDIELSLNTYSIAEINHQIVGCCSLIFTNHNYYQSKGELFPIWLERKHLENFVKNANSLPDVKNTSENKDFVEYIYVDEKSRGMGVAKKMINEQMSKISNEYVYINVLENNISAIEYYEKIGFTKFQSLEIDNQENKIYPCVKKLILLKKI